MSTIDIIKKNNEEQVQEKHDSALEYMEELERKRVAAEGYTDPHLALFKEKRKKYAMRNKRF
jgi:hypothetical protein